MGLWTTGKAVTVIVVEKGEAEGGVERLIALARKRLARGSVWPTAKGIDEIVEQSYVAEAELAARDEGMVVEVEVSSSQILELRTRPGAWLRDKPRPEGERHWVNLESGRYTFFICGPILDKPEPDNPPPMPKQPYVVIHESYGGTYRYAFEGFEDEGDAAVFAEEQAAEHGGRWLAVPVTPREPRDRAKIGNVIGVADYPEPEGEQADPDKEPEKVRVVRPWRKTWRMSGLGTAYRLYCPRPMCKWQAYFDDEAGEIVWPAACPECGVAFGEPRDLSEVPDE